MFDWQFQGFADGMCGLSAWNRGPPNNAPGARSLPCPVVGPSVYPSLFSADRAGVIGWMLWVFLVGQGPHPWHFFIKVWHSCVVKSGPLDSQWEKEKLPEKNAVSDGQERKRELTRQTVSWQARSVTGEAACLRRFVFCSRNPVKSPSSVGNYKSGFESCRLYVYFI